MKRFLKVFLVVLLVVAVFCVNCAFAEIEGYDAEFDVLLEEMETLKANADFVISNNLQMWHYWGADGVMPAIATLLYYDSETATEVDDYMIYTGLDDVSTAEECPAVAEKYQLAFKSLDTSYIEEGDELPPLTIDMVKDAVKAFRDKYKDKHEDGVQALRDYYIKLESYAEFATSPSGSYVSYSQDSQTYEKELQELKSNAEFDK